MNEKQTAPDRSWATGDRGFERSALQGVATPPLDVLPKAAADLRKALAHLQELAAESRTAGAAVQELERSRAAAAKADDEALARAIAANAPDPGAVNTRALEAKLEDAKRQARARHILLLEAQGSFAELASQRQSSWVDAVEEHIEAARSKYSEAIAAAVEARDGFRAALGLRDFVGTLPEVRTFRARDAHVRLSYGDVGFGEIIGALQTEAAPRQA